jgi:hypothetical protein
VTTHACRVCAAAVRSAQEGVIFRVGGRVLVLCTTHLRLAQTSAIIMGQAAVRGIERVLEAQHPEAMHTLRGLGESVQQMDAALVQRVTVTTPKRRAKYEDVIDADFVEVKT